MAKYDRNKTYPLIDVVATIYAAAEYQLKAVRKINATYDINSCKPSEKLYVPLDPVPSDEEIRNGAVTREYFPSLTSYTKMTLGMDARWLDENSEIVTVTAKHREDAQAGIDTIKNKIMIMVLKSVDINGFIASLSAILELDEVKGCNIGLLTYVPKTAQQFHDNDATDDKKTAFMDSKPLGALNAKVAATVTIFNIRPMGQYDCILYEGNDDNGNLITFFKNIAAKAQFELDETYKITGKLKAVGETPYSFGAIVNTINYVKVAK